MTVRPVKTQISLGICPVRSESWLCAQWVAKDPSFLHADSEDSDQTGRMPRLIRVFAGRTYYFVGFVMKRLICYSHPNNVVYKWAMRPKDADRIWIYTVCPYVSVQKLRINTGTIILLRKWLCETFSNENKGFQQNLFLIVAVSFQFYAPMLLIHFIDLIL